MKAILSVLLATLMGFFQTRAALQLEILALRHQLIVLQRRQKCHPKLKRWDRLIWVWLSSLWSGWRDSLVIVKPDTVIRWHREGFRLFWKLKSNHRCQGRPTVTNEVRELVRRICMENPLGEHPAFMVNC